MNNIEISELVSADGKSTKKFRCIIKNQTNTKETELIFFITEEIYAYPIYGLNENKKIFSFLEKLLVPFEESSNESIFDKKYRIILCQDISAGERIVQGYTGVDSPSFGHLPIKYLCFKSPNDIDLSELLT